MSNTTYKISLSYRQILDLVRQLPQREKVKISHELAREAVGTRLSRLLHVFKTDDLDEEEVRLEVEKARAENHSKKQLNSPTASALPPA